MSNEKPLTLKTILDKLKAIANEVRSDSSFCKDIKEELEEYGYDWFGDLSSLEGEDLKEQVMKVLAVAVNEAIQKKVDLGYGKKVVKPELHQLLNNGKHKSRDHHFIPVDDPFEFELRSPLDMAKYLKKTKTHSAPQWLVESIIQHQFDITWNTPDGDPDDYTFYQFCDNENTTDLLKYIPRQAHVKATLYKECRRKSVNDLRGITKENLCPTVYMRTTDEWVSWRADEDEFNDIEDINTHLSWIDSSILTFITENADEQSPEVESLKKSLEKPTLYWAVLDDSDFVPGEKLKLKVIGQTQVYIGRAINGIQGRWTKKDGKNHCEMMKKCLDNVCAMTTYDSLRLEDISLVDARLTLAKVRRERTALFVIKTFGGDVEEAEVAVEKARMRLDEAKESLRKASEESMSEASEEPEESEESATAKLREEVEERQDELDEATAVLNAFWNDSKPTKSDATVQLKEAEKWHQKGKRVDSRHKNIIPYKDKKFTWTPTDMRYGMNN